ncbi:MAG: response regulator [Rickettsiales bacterium]
MVSNILVIDSGDIQKILEKKYINNSSNYKILTAKNSVDAISSVVSLESLIALMIIDVTYFGAGSVDLIQAIRLYSSKIPIIIITEYGNYEFALDAINKGANDFLTKPISIDRLWLSIRNSLKISNLYRKIEQLEKRLKSDGINSGGDNVTHLYSVSSLLDKEGKIKKLRILEEDAIRYALGACGGSMSKAARSLGIGRSTLYRKVSELDRHSNNNNYLNHLVT